jgi:isocitrate dehydrogenase
MYWAQELALQDKDTELKSIFTPIAADLTTNESKLVTEFVSIQGRPVDIGGYYHPDPVKTSSAMRPSPTFNAILAKL